MNNKIVGAILLSAAGVVAAIGAVGAQIASAIVLGQFYLSKVSGDVPPGPEHAMLHWSVIVATLALATAGLFSLFCPCKSEKC
jgi:hypothetical protein